jgi:poly-gamma-glutamate capsule biosynthesis protein CapA/YwtB (metallophosphatase superfamily)
MAAAEGKRGSLPRLVMVGDVATEFVDPKKMMAKIAPYIRESAIAFCNCEWPLTTKGQPWPGKAGRVVRSSPGKLDTYTFPGYNVVTLANNHVMNFGAEGLMETIEVLDKAGIAHCGAGKNLAEAHKPAIVSWNGTKIAFLGYTCVFTAGFEAKENKPGMAVVRTDVTYRAPSRLHEVPGLPMIAKTSPRADDAKRMVKDIQAAKRKAHAVVVAFHWGVSGGHQHLIGYQKELGRMAIDAGAKVVVGHHPHTIQPVELYKNGVIAYSLNHCGFDMESDSHAEESIVLEMAITKSGLDKPFVRPVGNAVERPEILTLDQGRSAMEWLARMSRAHGTSWKINKLGAEPVAKGGRTSFV